MSAIRGGGIEPIGGEIGRDDIALRLRRIEGQISGIRRMHEGGRSCVDVLDQVAAARAGLGSVGLILLERHVDACLRDAHGSGDASTRSTELVAVVRRFARSA